MTLKSNRIKALKEASSLRELAKAARALERGIEKDVNDIAKEAARKLAFFLIYETPVDTSQALSNWRVSFAIPSAGTRLAFKEGEQGSTKEYSAVRAYREAQSLISKKNPHIDLIISNNLSYIHKLNMGGSNQQPTAFYIERIINRVNVEKDRMLKDYLNGY